jgi:hypothetical protein
MPIVVCLVMRNLDYVSTGEHNAFTNSQEFLLGLVA